MTNARDVTVVVGSLRRDSLNRKLANALRGLAPAGLTLEIVEIRDLPLYNEDLEATVPPAWATFRARIARADAVLFVSPEYNRSVPGVLKNALDVGSRPYGRSAWDGKPAAIATLSPGAIGGFGANHHLRQSLVFLNMPTLQQPEVYIGGGGDLFDQGGRITTEATSTFLTQFLHAFADWIERVQPSGVLAG